MDVNEKADAQRQLGIGLTSFEFRPPKLISNDTSAVASYANPGKQTLAGLALALMLQGRVISTPSFTFSGIHATRLPAYIHHLQRYCIPAGWVVSEPMPLTPRQRQRGRRKPFQQYRLTAQAITEMGAAGQQWAEAALAYWRGEGVRPESFPVAEATLAAVAKAAGGVQ